MHRTVVRHSLSASTVAHPFGLVCTLKVLNSTRATGLTRAPRAMHQGETELPGETELAARTPELAGKVHVRADRNTDGSVRGSLVSGGSVSPWAPCDAWGCCVGVLARYHASQAEMRASVRASQRCDTWVVSQPGECAFSGQAVTRGRRGCAPQGTGTGGTFPARVGEPAFLEVCR